VGRNCPDIVRTFPPPLAWPTRELQRGPPKRQRREGGRSARHGRREGLHYSDFFTALGFGRYVVQELKMDRRDFFKTTGAGGLLAMMTSAATAEQPTEGTAGDRDVWVAVARRLADPVLNNLANGTLKARMPVEQAPGADRRGVTHLEALGRLIAGMAGM